MSQYTVKQIAKAAGVSVRTLHHYHEIGLLVPRNMGANGYRYYGEAELLRLQQILLYRGFGLALAEVQTVLDAPDFDTLKALHQHKARLEAEAKRLPELIRTLARTIETIQGHKTMHIDTLYQAFPPEKQAAYEAELARESPEMPAQIARSKAAIGQDHAAHMRELHDIEASIIANMQAGLAAEAPENAALIARHRAWVGTMWGRPCVPEAHIGLAQMYEAHPDFNQRYEALAKGFTAYICASIRAHLSNPHGVT